MGPSALRAATATKMEETMIRWKPWMLALVAPLFVAGCSPADDSPPAPSAASIDTTDLAGACEDYIDEFNRVAAKSVEHYYKLFQAAGRVEASIESERDRWLFLGGQVQQAMLDDEWASLTVWHRNLQDHLASIAILSGENNYNFPEDAEAAVKMGEELEHAYVRCKFYRNFVM